MANLEVWAASYPIFVMAGLDPAIQPSRVYELKRLDGRLKGGHDDLGLLCSLVRDQAFVA